MHTIKAINIDNSYNILKALDMLNEISIDKKLRCDTLTKLKLEYDSKYKESVDKFNDYIEEWRKLLGGYYHIKMKKSHDGIDYSKEFYIYPYRILKENLTLWVLKTFEKNEYKGGVDDTCMNMDDMCDYDIELKPINSEEFLQHAKSSIENLINLRMKKEHAKLDKENI